MGTRITLGGQSVLVDRGFVIRQTLLVVFAALMVLPFIWLVISSLKTEGEIFSVPIKWLPEKAQWSNYLEAIESAPFGTYYFNSLKISFFKIAGAIFFSALTAFAFAKLWFRGKNKLFLIYLATMMIPPQVTLIPTYIIMSRIGWVNTHLPLIIPGMFSAYFTFMLRQFYLSIPDSLIEAAKIDGYGYFRIFLTIILPLSKSALISMSIVLFVWTWNDVLTPLIYLDSQRLYTVAQGMGVFKQEYFTEFSLLFAASVVSLVPLLIAYLLGQRFFQKGLATSGIKG